MGASIKGRQLNAPVSASVTDLLQHLPPRRDLLIEALHILQDHFGFLSPDHLAALAHYMRLAQGEVFEVASFYHHFSLSDHAVSHDHAKAPTCNSIVCALKNPAITETPTPCIGQCDKAPARFDATPSDLSEYQDFDTYRAEGGYQLVEKLRTNQLSKGFVLDELTKADLRGLGGAGFPVAQKWRFFDQPQETPIVVINADEGEPGTFKDRHCLEHQPHWMLEGALIAAHSIKADTLYIYLRNEYPLAKQILTQEIAKLTQSGLCTGITIHLRRGAGAYICGEETALLESLEGKRGLPRIKPPFPAQQGLFGRPTLIHNVETLYRVREILAFGAEQFLRRGCPRFFSVSGRVKNPGVIEAPRSANAQHLIEACGGIEEGHRFKAFLPGGASGGILPAALGHLSLDFKNLDPYGCFVGSGAVVILSDQDDLRAVVLNLLSFFEDESCGQCTPCRVGCSKLVDLLSSPAPDLGLIKDLSDVMRDASICGLGQAAPNPVKSILRFFPEVLA